MRLIVATNFKKDFILAIAKYNTVTDIYGKVSGDFIGGGRSSYMFSHVSERNVEQHVKDAHIYKAMGYDHFKLVELGMPTALLEKRVKAFTEKLYDGNFLGLVQPYGYQDKEKRNYETIF